MQALYVEILESNYKKMNEVNPSFSMNAFARVLSMSPSQLNEVLKGKCGLSVHKAEGIALKIKLSPSEKKIFLLSVKAQHSRRKADKERYAKELGSLRKNNEFLIESAHYNLVSNWETISILELLKFKDFELTTKWLSKKLAITNSKAKDCIETFKKLKLIKKNDQKKWVSNKNGLLKSTHDVPSTAIQKHHSSMLKRSAQSLLKDKVEERDFQSAILCIEKEDFAVLKKDIRSFQKKILKKYAKAHLEHAELVTLNTQFFKLARDD